MIQAGQKILDWFSQRWVLYGMAFSLCIVFAVGLRVPFLSEGHVDEVHTIGRALNIVYTGDFNPHFFNYSSGTIYFCVPANIVSLALVSKDAGNMIGNAISPLQRFKRIIPNPINLEFYSKKTANQLWEKFKYYVRFQNMLLVPLQILLIAYIGYRVNLLFPCLAAGFLLAFCGANIRDATTVTVNNTTAVFSVLTLAVCLLFFTLKTMSLWKWFLQVACLGFVVGLAIACKYNAAIYLLIPLLFIIFTIQRVRTSHILELGLSAFGVAVVGSVIGFTLLSPYWFEEFSRFIQDVLYEVWHYKTGHRDYNTFTPGLEMLGVYIRNIAIQMSYIGLLASVAAIGATLYVWFKGELSEIHQWLWGISGITSLTFLVFMSNQAVFFDRNLTIFWVFWFLLCTSSWWFASGYLAQRFNFSNPERIQYLSILVLLLICIIEANFIDYYLLDSSREWWMRNGTVVKALSWYFGG